MMNKIVGRGAKVMGSELLNGGTGFRLVGCLRADGRSFASIGVGTRRPWHTPRPDLSLRFALTQKMDLRRPAATGSGRGRFWSDDESTD